MSKHHYVYYSYEPWGRAYIGVRTCSCLPQEDTNYFGSFKDKTFKPTEKIVLMEFASRKEAIAAEIYLHDFYQVHINPAFANQALQTSVRFNRQGLPGSLKNKKLSYQTKEKLRQAKLGTRRTPETRRKISQTVSGSNNPFYGRQHTEESKLKISNAKKGKPGSWTGKKHSEETKEKMRQAKLKKQKHSPC